MSLKKLASLIVKISANGAQAQAEFRKLEKSAQDFGKSMKRIGNNMTKYVTVPLAAIATASVAAANTQLQAEAKLLNALKGREDVQKRLMEQASQTQSRTLFGDEAIIEQQAYLAALGLSEQQINDTIEAAVQLSAALGMDLTAAVKNLAKTYGGMTGELGESIPALKNFTQEQLKAGDAIGYVNANYKGFAESAAETGTGSLTQLQNKLGDLAEKIGTILIPVLEKVVVVLEKFVDALSKLPEGAQTAVVGLGVFLAAIGPILSGLSSMTTLLTGVVGKLGSLSTAAAGAASSLGPVVAAISALFALPVGTGIELTNTVNEGLKKRYKNVYDKNFAIYSNEIIDEATAANALTKAWEEYKKAEEAWKKSGEKAMSAEMWNVRDAAAKFEAIKAAYKQRFMQEPTSPVVAEDVAETNKALERELGLIGETEEAIKRLREELKYATSEEQIARIYETINANERYLETLTDEKNILKNLNKYHYERGLYLVGGIYGEPLTFGVSGPKASPLEGVGVTEEQTTAWIEKQKRLYEHMQTVVKEMNDALSNAVASAAVGVGEMLGDLITGEEFNPIQRLLEMLGKLLKDLGTALMTYAGLIEAFKKAFSNPYVAIAVGVAAVAAGQVFMNLAKKPIKLAQGGLAYGPTMAVVGDNPGAANDPEVVAPLSKLRDYMGRQKLELTGEIEWELRGDVLRAVLDRENLRLATLGR